MYIHINPFKFTFVFKDHVPILEDGNTNNLYFSLQECITEQVMKTASGGQKVLKKEQAYIRKQLGVNSAEEHEEEREEAVENMTATATSSDAGYISEEDRPERKCMSFIVDLELDNHAADEINLKNLPHDLQKILGGIDEGLPNEYSVPIDDKPEWLDMKKFKIGQEFARKYYFGLNYSEMLALMILFAFPDALQPLIFTENSGTPFAAFKRYLSTVLKVKSWFEHDVWSQGNPGYGNMKAVRTMHLNVSKRLNSSRYEDIKDRLTLRKEAGVWCPLKDEIQEDFRSSCPFRSERPIDHERVRKVFVNQTDMSITQFGFVGLMLLYPERFGAAGASDEELEGFAHLWRGLGHLLGIRDTYNFCAGSLAEVRLRSHSLIERWAKPSLQHVTDDWEHMSRCLVEGVSWYVPGVSFEVSLFYLCWVLGVPAPRLYAAMSWPQVFMFNLMKFTFHVTLRIPLMLPLHNRLIRSALAKASELPPERLKRLENKTYDYESKRIFNTRL